MEIVYGKHFIKAAKKLTPTQKNKLANLIEVLSHNAFDSRLHSKHLTGKLSGLYSFRLGRDFRVLFQFLAPSIIQLVDIANRKDIYK